MSFENFGYTINISYYFWQEQKTTVLKKGNLVVYLQPWAFFHAPFM